MIGNQASISYTQTVMDQFLFDINNSSRYGSLYGLSYLRLRRESRRLYSSSEARAIINRLANNVINKGLTLEASPLFNLLNIQNSQDQKKWSQETEDRWKLWSISDTTDVSQRDNFQQMQKIAYESLLRDGEFFVILRYSTNKELLNPLQIQQINPDQIFTPLDIKTSEEVAKKGHRIIDGIEIDKNDVEIAYYVFDYATRKSKRIPRIGPRSKRAFVIHGYTTIYPGQLRGIPILTPVIQELKKLSDYTVAEIMAAVINASIVAWVEPSDTNNSSKPLGGVKIRSEEAVTSQSDEKLVNPPSDGLFSKPGLVMQNLKAGEKINSYDTKRPNLNFDTFVTSVKKNISSSLGIPIEVLDLIFGSNFSASRASLILFWNVVEYWRSEMSYMFLNKIYKEWFTGEVQAQRIKAPGFFDSLTTKQAWLNSSWVGISKPSIDPMKESRAVNQRIKDGLTTRERAAREYNGSSFDENVERLKGENESLTNATPNNDVV
jgi:lambda family phage portal protein